MSGLAIFFTVLFSMLGCIFLIVIGLVVYSHWSESRRKRFYWDSEVIVKTDWGLCTQPHREVLRDTRGEVSPAEQKPSSDSKQCEDFILHQNSPAEPDMHQLDHLHLSYTTEASVTFCSLLYGFNSMSWRDLLKNQIHCVLTEATSPLSASQSSA